MNADEIFNATKELQGLFASFLDDSKLVNDTGSPTHEPEELVRRYAARAVAVVVKHDKWPADLNAQLKKVVAYIEANQGRYVEGHERVQADA